MKKILIRRWGSMVSMHTCTYNLQIQFYCSVPYFHFNFLHGRKKPDPPPSGYTFLHRPVWTNNH